MTILLIALSLAMDAFAVAVSTGITQPNISWWQRIRLGLWFGGFQFMMPLVGWFMGMYLLDYMGSMDHWIAFGLLSFIGGRMVWNVFHQTGEETPAALTIRQLAMLATATSIDALAVGVSFSCMEGISILPASIIIGVVAFVLSVVGVCLGNRLGVLFQRRAELLGGLILIGIGVKILVEAFVG